VTVSAIRRGAGVALAGVLVVAGACGGGGNASADEAPARAGVGGRSLVEARWDTLFTIGGGVEDTLLLMPRQLAARGGRLYVFDYGDDRLKAFDAEGGLRWSFGRRGGGPEEFGNPLDVEVGPEGMVWVVDGEEGRLSVVSAEGEGVRIVRHPDVLVRDVVPLTDRLLVTTASHDGRFWLALDGEGRVRESGEAPFPELAAADLLARQGHVAVGEDGQRWAAVFPFGRPFAVYEGTEVRCRGELVEGEGFPARMPADPRSAVWAVGAVLGDTSLFVLPRGRTELALRALDEYSARDCRYLGSVRLPDRVVAMAASEGVFYLAVMEPAPRVLAVRMRGVEGGRR
jgi:hypothetical protein